ncbi:MAG TPA: ribosome maturation factor RimP [Bacillota bacterium]|jgi:ribosome maturation factor RimP|nr:ribosome maturation factor RimP [Peptococcaceae bacterium MAG4]NLW38284.1 ribosome maturation factor RimP [Peptococcaceae bacterium]HPZ44345.1 ribosome maturation factor RimP [Bacillota bacterium]HQD76995.1 ribosome maturation factor RimP [Bacillota bacterium]HUM59699.1 ribosome maturation factor RimP [Bacillota bacterium]
MSKKRKIAEIVAEIARPVVEEAGLELVDVEYVKEGGHWCLRIFIDKPGGVGIEDCELVSLKIDKLLDEKDPIPQAYSLEVSSPGIDRPLRKPADFNRNKGRRAIIKTYQPINGKKEFSGRLGGVSADSVVLETDESGQLLIPIAQVALAQLDIEF